VTIDVAQATTNTVNLTVSDATAGEPSDPGSFMVTRSTTGPNLTVFYTISGTATNGTDYSTLSGSVVIPSGMMSASIMVTPIDDAIIEGMENVTVTLTANANYTLGAGTQGTVSITDNDMMPGLSINDVMMMEGQGGITTFTFTVSLSWASAQTVTVNYATANGTATAPIDYGSTSGILTFNPGQTSKTIAVSVNGDTTSEMMEAFFVNLSGAVNAWLLDGQGIGTIMNDDM
jgi:hypothetical protein